MLFLTFKFLPRFLIGSLWDATFGWLWFEILGCYLQACDVESCLYARSIQVESKDNEEVMKLNLCSFFSP